MTTKTTETFRILGATPVGTGLIAKLVNENHEPFEINIRGAWMNLKEKYPFLDEYSLPFTLTVTGTVEAVKAGQETVIDTEDHPLVKDGANGAVRVKRGNKEIDLKLGEKAKVGDIQIALFDKYRFERKGKVYFGFTEKVKELLIVKIVDQIVKGQAVENAKAQLQAVRTDNILSQMASEFEVF